MQRKVNRSFSEDNKMVFSTWPPISRSSTPWTSRYRRS